MARPDVHFIPTDHAVRRYRERVEPCSATDAAERIEHAASIARRLSPAEAWPIKGRSNRPGAYHLFCAVENLALVAVCETPGVVWILTVFRVKARVCA